MKDRKIDMYAVKRAAAIREFSMLRNRLLSCKCSVDTINRAFTLKKLYKL